MTTMSTTNTKLNAWVDEVAQLTQPDSIHWCTGSEDEWHQITDGAYVVASMRVMTRMGTYALERIGSTRIFVEALDSVGAPLIAGQTDVP